MRTSLRLSLLALVAGVGAAGVVVACSLDEAGLLGDSDDGGDATTDAGVDGCGVCSDMLAAGWQLVAVQPNGSSCPTSDALQVLLENVDSGPGLCDCSCAEAQGGCENGQLNIGYLANCATAAETNVDGGCDRNGGTLYAGGFQAVFTPSNSTACTPQVIVNDAAISATPNAVCRPPTTCDETLCNGTPPAGFSACIMHTGDTPCPTGAFQQRHLLGQTSVSCSSCSCACTGNFEYYYDNQCEAGAMTVGPSCTTVTNPGTAVASDRWNSGGCVASGARDGSVGLTNETTVCCR